MRNSTTIIRKGEISCQNNKNSTKELLIACHRYSSAAGGPNKRYYYIPVEFVGKRFYRVIVYSMFALVSMLLTITLRNYKANFIPSIEFHVPKILALFAIATAILAAYLILRYVFMFISYLRNSTAFHPYMVGNVYIHEPDTNSHNPQRVR